MEKKFKLDDELDVLLDEQLIREAELLERELFSDENAEAYTETEEETQASYEKLVERLKADGIYREEMSDKEKTDTKEQKSKTVGTTQKSFGRGKRMSARRASVTKEERCKRRRHLSVKIAGIIVVSGICVFSATMTSEANRKYWLHNMKILTGQDTRVVSDNDETNDKVETEEYTAIADIEEKLGVDMPELYYRPDKFAFRTFEVDTIAEIARLEYEYKGNIITFHIDKAEDESNSFNSSIIGEEIKTVKIQYEDIDAHLGKVKDTDDTLSASYAKWKRKNINYFIYGRIGLEELEKIIKKLVF